MADQCLILPALWYLRNGFRLIPLRGKIPDGRLLPLDGETGKPTFRPWFEQENTEAEVRRWFGKPGVNIGLLMGHSGVVAVDCDSRDEALYWWNTFPRTPMLTRTRSGVHFFYRVSPGDTDVGNRAKVFRRPIDVRGFGGYVVAPPSVHPDSGEPYERIGTWKLADVPLFDRSWIATPPPERKAPIKPPANSHKAVERGVKYISRIRAISGNGGHNDTFRAACRLAGLGLTEEQMFDVLWEWNRTNADPPWSEWEIRHKVADAIRNAGRER